VFDSSTASSFCVKAQSEIQNIIRGVTETTNVPDITPSARLWDQIDHDLGVHDHNMLRDRPYTGQPHTQLGARGSQEIKGITFRDLRDCFLRAFIQSHPSYVPGTLNRIEPNATLYEEAEKGEHAAICDRDIYNLNEDYGLDPIAVSQNLACEIEKLMGIYPNVDQLTVITLYGEADDNSSSKGNKDKR